MALFFVSNKYVESFFACQVWENLFGNANITETNSGYYIAISNGYRKKKIVNMSSDDTELFGFGTFFSEDGFGENSIKKDFSNIEKVKNSDLFGHYVFIISENKKINISTDKIGMINVFYSNEIDTVRISNDIVLLESFEKEVKFSVNGVKEFLLNESTIGTTTIFENISRLKLGHYLSVEKEKVSEFNSKPLLPINMCFNEYTDRINKYFRLIDKYEGLIASEMSAGFDTRTVAACACKNLNSMILLTNDNINDCGVDNYISSLVARDINLPIFYINRDKIKVDDKLLFKLLHATSAGRDLIRSQSTLDIIEKKYKHADIIIGGYGGEVLRGQYCKYKDFHDFSLGYYGGRSLNATNDGAAYSEHVTNKLKAEYENTWISTPEQLCQWLYACDRMRIWGGSRVLAMSLYGDNLHPFMDWYLIEPLLLWDYSEIKDAKLQKKIINFYAPELKDIPFNSLPKGIALENGGIVKKHKIKSRFYFILKPLIVLEDKISLYFIFRKLYKNFTFVCNVNFRLKFLRQNKNINSRMQSFVIIVNRLKYIKNFNL